MLAISRMKARENMLAKHGSALAALLAAGVALPSLRLPFLRDDWIESGERLREDRLSARRSAMSDPCAWAATGSTELWASLPFCLMQPNLILIAMAAMFVVLLVRRYAEAMMSQG